MQKNTQTQTAINPIPTGYHTITPYLVVRGAGAALDFYKRAFGGIEIRRIKTPTGAIGHAEVKIGDSIIMLTEELPTMGTKSPKAFGGTPLHMIIYTENVDVFVKKASQNGAVIKDKVEQKFFGDRMGTLEDPFGHLWYIATHMEDVSDAEMQRRSDEMMSKRSS